MLIPELQAPAFAKNRDGAVMRIELTLPAWKAGALPLSYTRIKWSGREDLNLRPPAPKAGASKLRYAR